MILRLRLKHRNSDHNDFAGHPKVHIASQALAKTAQQAEDTLISSLDKAERLHHIARDERTEQEGGVSIAAERLEEAADTLYSSVTDCQNAIKVLAPSLDVTQERINHLSTQMLSTTPPPTQTQTQIHTQPTYSSVAAAHLPPKVDQAIGRTTIRAHQILLDPNPGSSPFPPATTNKEIAARMKEALINIRNKDTPAGDVKAITVLRNSAIVVELDSESLASWL
ncbi:uncharacterized protein HD556DRAFT_1488033 [Suillus plorans]|uniref:Uncharacterized protein n=1 Tax=Suillus plorans TaxID=116603 RepID=A0A9P7DF25_9AGAM|nr:uncharacterized protein HD556DRAFT_1488033 [Suillus plorans]KAG1790858.1 hypothetical protein HD556DRAFT_1488033 [Suillus plorans]